jgi:hypothetical protein
MAQRSVRLGVRSRKLSNVGQLVIGWVTKNLLSRAPPCFGRHVKPLVPAAFAVVSSHQHALGPRGPFSLCVIHKEESICPSSGDINRLMMMMIFLLKRRCRAPSDDTLKNIVIILNGIFLVCEHFQTQWSRLLTQKSANNILTQNNRSKCCIKIY